MSREKWRANGIYTIGSVPYNKRANAFDKTDRSILRLQKYTRTFFFIELQKFVVVGRFGEQNKWAFGFKSQRGKYLHQSPGKFFSELFRIQNFTNLFTSNLWFTFARNLFLHKCPFSKRKIIRLRSRVCDARTILRHSSTFFLFHSESFIVSSLKRVRLNAPHFVISDRGDKNYFPLAIVWRIRITVYLRIFDKTRKTFAYGRDRNSLSLKGVLEEDEKKN